MKGRVEFIFLSFIPIPCFALVADSGDANYTCGRRALVERDIAGVTVRDHEFAQSGPGTCLAADLGMRVQDQDGVADPMHVLQRGCRIALEVEVENTLKIFERLDRKDDHAMRRGLGRAGLPPRARFSR